MGKVCMSTRSGLKSCVLHVLTIKSVSNFSSSIFMRLMPTERSMIDAASGGALVDKTPQQARVLISNIAINSQQFNTRPKLPVRKMNEISTSTSLE